jgi:hypothetical protein
MNDSTECKRRLATRLDAVTVDLLGLETELRETQRDRDSYRELLNLTLTQLRDLTERARMLTRRVRTLIETARDIRQRAA